jgi:tRNA pseudouridine55 synthase
VLLVDKPGDHTSHDVIARLRGKLRMKKIGHAGTLDPMATGLLIVLVGKATRVSQYLISLDKEYEGTIELGKTTDSQDADGEVMETRPGAAPDGGRGPRGDAGVPRRPVPDPADVLGHQDRGVPLYKKARKGEEVEREPRFIRVMSWELSALRRPGSISGCAAPRAPTCARWPTTSGEARLRRPPGALRRTATDRFNVAQALTLEQIEALSIPEIEKRLIPVHQAVPSVAL